VAMGCVVAIATCSIVHAQAIVIKRAEITRVLAGQNPITETIDLPLNWDKKYGMNDGTAIIKLQFDWQPDFVDLGMFIPKIGNAFNIKLNGSVISSFGVFPPSLSKDSARTPLYFLLPHGKLKANNDLEISIAVNGGRLGGLSKITIGPPAEVETLFRREYFWQIDTAYGSSFGVVLGIFSLLLWWSQRDKSYLYYALGELFWSVLPLRHLLEQAPIVWPWWGILQLMSFNLACPFLIKSTLIVLNANTGWASRLANVQIMLSVPAALLTLLTGQLWMITLFQGASIVGCIGMFFASFPIPKQEFASEYRVVAFSVGTILICSARDIFVFRISDDAYGLNTWTRFAWGLFGLSMAWIISERLRRSKTIVKEMNEIIENRVGESGLDLNSAFDRTQHDANEAGVLKERERFVRDLHDGLGGHLVNALHVAKKYDVTKEELTSQLREAVDQLKITVDALHEADGDIAAILGAVRHRLTPRFLAARVHLTWNVESIPIIQSWDSRQAFQLQMILYEAFTNIIIHSGATEAELTGNYLVESYPPSLQIQISDNGRGFDVSGDQHLLGKGLSNMQKRAKEIDGKVEIYSNNDGTRVTLTIQLKVARKF
jgi:signal transduction histidine kinase